MNNFLILLLCSFLVISCNGSQSSDPDFGENNSENHTPEVPVPTLGAADVVASESTIVSAGSIVANGVSTAIVTITLKAMGGNPVAGVVPTFSATDTSSTNVYGACSSSNLLGVSTCTLASSIPELKLLHLIYPVAFNGGSIQFINDSIDHVNSYISADDLVVADGSSLSTVRIKLVDIEGNAFSGTPTFRATNGNSANTYGACSVLNASGESTCTLKTTKAEAKRLEVLTPTYLSGDIVQFVAGAPDATTSTITASGNTASDGVASALITVNLRDSFSNPVSNVTPLFTATDTASKNVYGLCSPSALNGNSACSMTSKKAEVKTLSLTSPISFSGGTVNFVPGQASGTYSSITGTSQIVADGVATSVVSIVLKDASENPISNVIPTFSATDSGIDNSYDVCSVTDLTGASTCSMKSLSPEIKTLRLTSPLFSDGGTVKFLSPGMNIMVPIELMDRGLASATTAAIFNRTIYPLVTTDYVATSNTYYFEIMATNTNATIDYSVDLLGNGNALLGSVTVPKSTTVATRFRSLAIPMPAGANSLKIRMNASAVASQVTVQTAKLLIKQVGATETKLWLPLTAFDQTGSVATVLAPIFQSTVVTPAANATYAMKWNRQDSKYVELDSSAYKFEALMATNNAANTATVSLHNTTDNVAVAGSTINVLGTTYQWGSAALTDSASFLNNKSYELRLKVDVAARIAYVFKAGISIKLTNLSKAEILNRLYLRRAGTTSALLTGGRIKWEESDYAHPKTYVDTYGSVTVGGSASRELDDLGTSDSATATPLVVADSVILAEEAISLKRSPELFLTDGNRYLLYDRVNSGTFSSLMSFLTVKSTLR